MSDTIQITTRLNARLVARADELRDFVAGEVGGDASRAEVIRRAIALGVRELERRRSREAFDAEMGSTDDVPTTEITTGDFPCPPQT
jgi:hypothetical protein